MTCKPDRGACVPEACDVREAMAEAAEALQEEISGKNLIVKKKPDLGKELALAGEDYGRD